VLIFLFISSNGNSKAAQLATAQHPTLPMAVSPSWVLESWKQNCLALPLKFPPIVAPVAPSANKKEPVPSSSSSQLLSKKSGSSSSFFRGCLFSLVRVAPPAWAVDFDSKEEETFIKLHGGQMLTLRLLDILKADKKRGNRKRRCHVVCWGSSSRPQIELHPILSNVQRLGLCEIVLVTPFWLHTCVKIEKRVKPDRLASVFVPQPWPLRKLELVDRKTDVAVVAIAMTGFHWSERMAYIEVINAIGGTFHENMEKTSTHLVCKDKATGLKLEKAIQWGLHIVSIEWLHHIVRYGYGGEEKAKDGCEARFSLR
jgi:hypothetical protein